MRRTGWPKVMILSTLVVGGCGTSAAPTSSPDDTVATTATGPDEDQQYTGVYTVLEDTSHGPQLCIDGVMDSYPIQCNGIDLIGWDWASVEHAETVDQTTWGHYTVTGTWDGARLTVTQAGPPAEPSEPPAGGDGLPGTPCEPPDGGWAVVDDTKVSEAANDAALQYAHAQPDFADLWYDPSTNPAWTGDTGFSEDVAMLLNDPSKRVFNVAFTGDLARHEAAIREVWGGYLCVSEAPRSAADLQALAEEIQSTEDVLWASPDPKNGTVQVTVIVDDGVQQHMDESYGSGVVEVLPMLVAVE